MCQNTQNMKITPVTDICSKGNFVKKRVLWSAPQKLDVKLNVNYKFLYSSELGIVPGSFLLI